MFGPYGLNNYRTIKVGLIGTSSSIQKLKSFLNRLKSKINHSNPQYWPFPGLGEETSLKFNIKIINEKVIGERDLIKFEDDDPFTRVDRILFAIKKYEENIRLIKDVDPLPDVLILSIPKIIIKSCREKQSKYTNRIYLAKRQSTGFNTLSNHENGYNFHNILKCIGMEVGIPTQLIYPNSLEINPLDYGKQDPCTIAWNFSVALLYKANELPWKYFEFPNDTCFIGISFYKDYLENNKQVMRASVAQTFLADGNNIILRGKSFEWNEKESRSPHMSIEYSKELFANIIKKFEDHWNHKPNRVVVHKSSKYWDEEKEGINLVLKDISKIDLVTISNSNARFYRLGQEPVVRGTHIELYGKNYLYNTGYVPCLGNYPGPFIPAPLEIEFQQIDSDKTKIMSEILALARLNWNNVDYSTKEPVTLTFSRVVGEILSEPKGKKLSNPPEKYRFYM